MENNLNNILDITIKYRLKEINKYYTISLLPEEYFDLEWNDNQFFEIDSLPLYDHAIEYIKHDKKDILSTSIIIFNKALNNRKIIKERFWNKGKNVIIEVSKYRFDNLIHHELIYSTTLGNYPEKTHVLRYNKNQNLNIVTLDNIHTLYPDKEILEEFIPNKKIRIFYINESKMISLNKLIKDCDKKN